MRKQRRYKSAFILLLDCLVAVAPLQSCHRPQKVPHVAKEEVVVNESSPTPLPTSTPIMKRIMAAWYRVPKHSLARRRAADDELTAAHNTLPIGTRVRVTNPENGKSVTVRITDRGIHDRRVKLDLCKEAADELGVVEKGFARLKMQVLDESGAPGASQSLTAND